MTVTFDSSAWIEYFAGTDAGRIARSYIESDDLIYTSVLSLFEVKSKYKREGKRWRKRLDFMADQSILVDVDADIALKAADIRAKIGIHSMDALILATTRKNGTTLLTKDRDFEGFRDVKMIG